MMTYQDIQKANSTIKTTDIKGKAYAEVNQRIKAFRMAYPDGFITITDMSISDGVCIAKAEVGYYVDGNPVLLGSDYAYEKESSSFINKTSYIENCCTSAKGRALGSAGFGIDTSVASYEEVANAILNQDKPELPTKQSGDFTPTCADCGAEITPVEHDFSVKRFKKPLCRNCQNSYR